MTIDVNSKTTTDLLNAFMTAQSENHSAATAVSNAAAMLSSGWSGAAATTFGNSISSWMDGLSKVQNALAGLQDNMAQFASSNQNTEDDVLIDAGNWLGSGNGPTPPGTGNTTPTASWT
ncbi:WXG100 family type VII secretion target [Micromonospora radicis]|uniref:WXG100 family type VII secretion target n=1 Tax=Micromonospora radicis TaxID=1894971 RepID=A0A418MNW1_9ACTN|nr:WXG100 family type VII secretion target [Micromonospora radicis]RIV33193.1 WXG100 family type VII secretion target [Micromonospora radicis]